jgi:hypothetical protein
VDQVLAVLCDGPLALGLPRLRDGHQANPTRYAATVDTRRRAR